MKFLADQDVYALTTAFLRTLGHDVVTASETQSASLSDAEILESAIRVVIYLRIAPAVIRSVHEELERVLELYEEAMLLRSFVVVEPGRHRIRKSQ